MTVYNFTVEDYHTYYVTDLGIWVHNTNCPYKGTGKPLQKHHYATNRSKKYTPQIEAITKKYELDLDDVWNIELLPHQGRHPDAYHEYVLSNIRTFDKIAKGDKRKFLRLFEQLK